MSMSETPMNRRETAMKAQEISKLVHEWANGKVAEARAKQEAAEEWEGECWKRVELYEEECDRLPDDEHLESILVNEVYPNYDEAYKQRKEAEDRLERAERVMEALKELQAALEDWEA